MAASKIAITIDDNILKKIDILVKLKYFPNPKECAKLDPDFEQSIAEEGFSAEMEEWPEY